MAAIQGALAGLGSGTGVDRVYLFEMRDDAAGRLALADQIFEWVADGIEPQIGNPQLQGLPLADIFPRLFATLVTGHGITGDVETFDAAARSACCSRRSNVRVTVATAWRPCSSISIASRA